MRLIRESDNSGVLCFYAQVWEVGHSIGVLHTVHRRTNSVANTGDTVGINYILDYGTCTIFGVCGVV